MEWKHATEPVDYQAALTEMDARVADMIAGKAEELIWLLEHPPLFTAGTSAKSTDLLSSPFPVFQTGRGGQYTYHGPGQRIAYVMLDLKKRDSMDVRCYVRWLEEWIITTMEQFHVKCFTRDGRVGVWTVDRSGKECKIAALGIRIRKWVTFHGMSINVNPDLSHYAGIVPCGIKEYGVTSLATLGVDATMSDVDRALKETFSEVFFAGRISGCTT